MRASEALCVQISKGDGFPKTFTMTTRERWQVELLGTSLKTSNQPNESNLYAMTFATDDRNGIEIIAVAAQTEDYDQRGKRTGIRRNNFIIPVTISDEKVFIDLNNPWIPEYPDRLGHISLSRFGSSSRLETKILETRVASKRFEYWSDEKDLIAAESETIILDGNKICQYFVGKITASELLFREIKAEHATSEALELLMQEVADQDAQIRDLNTARAERDTLKPRYQLIQKEHERMREALEQIEELGFWTSGRARGIARTALSSEGLGENSIDQA